MKIKRISILLTLIFFTFSFGSLAKAYAQGNAQLSGLAMDVQISPAFSSDITEYTTSVTNNISAISITPTASDPESRIDVNGTMITESHPSATVPLSVGSNAVAITVSSPDASMTVYSLTITRAGSGNASLQELIVGAGYLSPAFNAGVYAYTLTTNSLAGCLHGQNATTAPSLSVTATAMQEDATITINGADAQSGVAQTIPLQMGANAISVVVTAQDGVTQNEYTINALRVSAAWQPLPYQITVSNAVVLRLTEIGGMTYAIYNGKLSQYLNGHQQYKVAIPGIDSDICEVTGWNGIPYLAFRDESGKACVMSYNGADWAALGQTGFSQGAAEDLQICVDAGGTFYVAFIDVANGRKATVMRNDGNGWEVVGSKAFTAGEASNLSLAVLGGAPALACCDASLGGKGVLWEFAGGAWEMAGDAPFSDGAAHNPSLAADGGTPYIIYQDETCSWRPTVKKFTGAIWETVGTPGIVPITTNVAIAVFGGDVHICLSGGNYFNEMVYDGTSWKSEGTSVNNGHYNGAFAEDDGAFYCIAYEDYPSTNQAVYISKLQDAGDVTLRWINCHDPVHKYFAYGINLYTIGDSTEYSVDIPGYIETIAICPQASDNLASIQIDGACILYNTKTCSLDFGPNVTTITVLSTDGSAAKTYTFTINRLKDDSLRGIGVSAGTLSPDFYPTDLDYTMKVDSGVKQLVLTPQAFDENVAIKINGAPVEPGQSSQPVALAIGNNKITLDVSSSDGILSETYTVTVNRAASSWQAEGAAYTGSWQTRCVYSKIIGSVPHMVVLGENQITVLRCTGTTWETINEYAVGFNYTYMNRCTTDGEALYLLLGYTLYRFTGNGWDVVCYMPGDDPIVHGLVVSGGVPYVLYSEPDVGSRLSLVRYINNSWESVGNGGPIDDSGFWANCSAGSDLQVSELIAYVAYINNTSDYDITVKKFDGTSWITLGGDGYSPCKSDFFALRISDGIPYLSYDYHPDGGGIQKFIDDRWEVVSSKAVSYMDVDEGNLYAVFDGNVAKFDGMNWSQLGDISISYGNSIYASTDGLYVIYGVPYRTVKKDDDYSLIKYEPANDASLMRVGVFSARGEPSYSASVLAQAGSQVLQAEAPCYLDEIYLEPAPADRYATVQIGGQTVAYGSRVPVQLNVGNNDIVITIQSADGTTNTQYTLRIVRKADASLKSLTTDIVALSPVFHPGTTHYDIAVEGTVNKIRLDAEQRDPAATVRINGTVASGQQELNVAAGENVFTISVTSADGTNTLYYQVDVFRTPFILQGIGNGLPADTEFSFASYLGTPYIAYLDSSCKLHVMKYNGAEWVEVGNAGAVAGSVYGADIAVDETTGEIYVACLDASDKMKVIKYTSSGWSDVSRSTLPSIAVMEEQLYVENGSVYLAYQNENNDVSISVAKFNGTQWVSLGNSGIVGHHGISFVVLDGVPYVASGASYSTDLLIRRYNGSGWEDAGSTDVFGSPSQLTLAIGNGELYAAYYGGKTTLSDIAVRKLTPSGWILIGDPLHVSNDNRPANLLLNASLGIPRVVWYSNYNQSNNIWDDVNGRWNCLATCQSLSGYSIIHYDVINSISWFVTIGNNGKNAIMKLQPIGDATMTGIALDDGTVISTMGAPDQNDYYVSTASAAVSVTPILSDANATVTVNGSGITNRNPSDPIPLDFGQNVVAITVRSMDETAEKTYALHITRKSTDSSLKSLSINGAPVPGFDHGTLSYDIGVVPGAKSSINIAASPNYPGASVSGTGICALKYGANTITITVTADDGVTVSKYTVQIYRQSDNSKLACVKVDNTMVSVDPGSTIIDFGSVGSGVNSVTLSATAEDPNAAITCPSSIPLDYGDNQCTISVASEDGTSTTSYTLKIYRERPSDNVTIEKIGCGTVTGSGRHYVGDTVSISAEPAEGYEFKQWRVDSGDVQLGNNLSLSTSFTMPGSAVSLMAVFEIRKCSASVQSGGHGKASGGGTFDWGAVVAVSAVPDSGYRFVRWSEGGNTVSSNRQYSFTITRDIALKAEFAKIGTPSIASIASSGYSSIKLGWAAVTGASGYELFRSTSATGTYSKVTAITGLTYTNTGLITGTTYYYKLRVYCTAGAVTAYGQFSAYKAAKPALNKPVASAAPATYNSIKITWGSIAGASKYEVYRSTSSAGASTLLATVSSPGYTNTSVSTGTMYYYKVRAYRLVDSTKIYSAFSAIASSKTALSTPGSVKAVALSYNKIKVTWSSIPGATKYVVYRATSSTGTYMAIATTGYTYYTNSDVNTGTTYYYKVRAYRLVGRAKVYSGYSVYASAKTVLTVPASVKAVRVSATGIKITWGAVAGATKYEVWRSLSVNSTFSLVSTTGYSYFTNTGLTSGVSYSYKIRAYRLVGTTKVYSEYSTAAHPPNMRYFHMRRRINTYPSAIRFTKNCFNQRYERSGMARNSILFNERYGNRENVFILE